MRAVGLPVRVPHLPAIPPMPAFMERGRERDHRLRRSAAEMHIEALEELAPPSVLCDEQWHVEHLSETAGRFLQPRGGPPTQTLTDLVRPELQDELRAVLHHAFELHEPCLSSFVPVYFNGTPRLVGMLVQPRARKEGREQRVLVTFLEAGKARVEHAASPGDASDALVLNLRDKLRISDRRLESMRQDRHGL
jgi:two-component system CheB/CheR fusion protein